MAPLPWEQVREFLVRFILTPIGLSVGDLAWFAIRVPRFILVVLLFYLIGRAAVWILGRTVLSAEPEDPMIRSLVESLTFGVTMLLGIGFGLMVFGVNLLNLAVTLGLIGAGLALGLRQSVANVMGGISLASDRPFEVGDRIQIGEFWGDVVDIGLRSTRVLTARREYVVIPNSLMDEREIWNYTKEYDELRIEVGVSISYDSDVERAQRIMEKVARDDPTVLDYPEPRALVRDFGDSGVELELWSHIGNARHRYYAASDLREQIHEAFREHGVEIPYPYRTLVEKQDLPEPQEGVPEGFAGDDLRDRRILVAISGSTPAHRKVRAITNVASQLEADIVLAFITSRPSIMTEREGEMAAELLHDAAAKEGIAVKLVMREGSIVDTVQELVREEGCGAAVIGASPPRTFMAWKRAHIEDRLRQRLDVPVITVRESLDVEADELAAARESLDELADPGDETAR